MIFKLLSADPRKWSNTLKQQPKIVDEWQQPTNFLSVFDHLVGLVLKGLTENINE